MKLKEYRACFDLTFDQFVAQNKINNEHIGENLRYEKIENVTRVDLPNSEFFFFKDNRLEMIYISDEVLAKKIWKEFKATANPDMPDNTVRSRAGKTSNQLIFASQGVAASVNKDDVDFIEIYPPCVLQDYLDKIYREVGPFIR